MRVQAVCSGSCYLLAHPTSAARPCCALPQSSVHCLCSMINVWDVEAGIVQRRLSNGIRVNYCHTDNEPRGAMLRVVAAGGRALEAPAAGPSGVGAVSIGARTLSESGTVGAWRRDQVWTLNSVALSFSCRILRSQHSSGLLSHFPLWVFLPRCEELCLQVAGDGVRQLLLSSPRCPHGRKSRHR